MKLNHLPRFVVPEGQSWLPLEMEHCLANTDEDIARNIEYALGLDYIPFNDVMGTKSGAVAVVGSGPSLKTNWQELKTFNGDIVACNASCQFLLDKGIVPQYMMCFDADPLMLEFITPHPDITYLLSSRCPPKAFDLLKGHKIICWHTAGDRNIQELLEKHGKMEPMVTGGTAAVTRGMVLVLPMGYKEVHIYGGDSSFSESGDTHIRKSTTEERRMAIKCNERVFEVAPWMTVQISDFKLLSPLFKQWHIPLFVHGDGLLQHVARELGFRTDYENAVQQWLREFKRDWTRKATILWQHI